MHMNSRELINTIIIIFLHVANKLGKPKYKLQTLFTCIKTCYNT